MRVLVIGDSEGAIRGMSDELRARGHEVYGTTSAIGASTLVVRHSVDAVVIDLELHSFPAQRLVELLRRRPRFEKLAVVLVSAKSPAKVEAVGLSSGADAIVSKSDLFLLPRAVSQAFATRRNQAMVGARAFVKVAGQSGAPGREPHW